jgi:hypothetical protein
MEAPDPFALEQAMSKSRQQTRFENRPAVEPSPGRRRQGPMGVAPLRPAVADGVRGGASYTMFLPMGAPVRS